MIRPKITTTLLSEDNERFFGPGPAELLKGVRVYGSLLGSSKAMGMSYSKGRRILKHAETALGYKLVERQQGGVHGGRAFLTPEAEDFMQRYETLADSISAYAALRLREIWEVSAPDTDRNKS